MYEWITKVLTQNAASDYLTALLVFFIVFALGYVFRIYIIKKIGKLCEKTPGKLDNLVVKIIESFRPSFYFFISLYIAVQFFLVMPDIIHSAFNYVFAFWLVFRLVTSITIAVDFFIHHYCFAKACNVGLMTILPSIATTLKFFVWLVAIVSVMSNVGIDVTTIIAGLGIGGIAFAFAFQKILADLFSAFVILIDRPFTVGDIVSIDGTTGSIKKIGLKTTRLDTSEGEVVITNEDMVSARIKNKTAINKRKGVIELWVSDSTPIEKLRAIPKILKEVIATSKCRAELDRINLKSLESKALVFEVVYYVPNSSFNEYININQELLFSIFEDFKRREIDLAYPEKRAILSK